MEKFRVENIFKLVEAAACQGLGDEAARELNMSIKNYALHVLIDLQFLVFA